MLPRAVPRKTSASRFFLRLAMCHCQFLDRMLPGFSKSGKDRTVRPCVAATRFGQIKQRAPHGFERRCLSGKILGMTKGYGLDLAAGPFAVVPKAQKSGYFINREPEVAGIGDETQALD